MHVIQFTQISLNLLECHPNFAQCTRISPKRHSMYLIFAPKSANLIKRFARSGLCHRRSRPVWTIVQDVCSDVCRGLGFVGDVVADVFHNVFHKSSAGHTPKTLPDTLGGVPSEAFCFVGYESKIGTTICTAMDRLPRPMICGRRCGRRLPQRLP